MSQESMPDLVTIAVNFEISPDSTHPFEVAWHKTFLPAIGIREGFTDCRLWKEWPRDTDPASGGQRYRLDITFETEELRMLWATSPEHEVAFGALRAISTPTSSMRLTSISTEG